MANKEDRKHIPIVSMDQEEREEVWDDLYQKEEGIIIEFDPDSNTGKIRSLTDNYVYCIDARELIRTKIELRSGDKVLFAPIESPSGDNYARIIRIIQLDT